VSFAVLAIALTLWHPFAPALFLGFYFGLYLDTWCQRTRGQHVQAVAILVVGMIAVALLGIVFHRPETMPLETRLFGFFVSYQTNEVNFVASLVAFSLTQMVVLSASLPARVKLAALLVVSGISSLLILKGVPLLLLWLLAVLVKVFCLRCWSLFFLALTAALFPLAGGIGSPMYALFAIVVATYVTALGWHEGERTLSYVRRPYLMGAIIAAVMVLLMIRLGINIPIVTRASTPLLAERERTYQLEKILAWQRDSGYCGYEIAFAEDARSPIDSVQSAITRRNRPPAALKDVQILWDTVLRCPVPEGPKRSVGVALVTFGGARPANLSPVFEVKGRYAGVATLWIERSQQ
jgi:hypothetical protein